MNSLVRKALVAVAVGAGAAGVAVGIAQAQTTTTPPSTSTPSSNAPSSPRSGCDHGQNGTNAPAQGSSLTGLT